MPCGGNKDEFCGGGSAMSVYQACGGEACKTPTIDVVGGLPKVRKRDLGSHEHLHRHAKKYYHSGFS